MIEGTGAPINTLAAYRASVAALRAEAQAIVDECKAFVRAMARAESSLGKMGATLTAPEGTEVLNAVLAWLGTDEVPAGYTREVARELIGQLSAAGAYADYHGSTDAYIQ